MERKQRRWRTTPVLQTRARQLRHEQTAAEAQLWEYLRDRQLKGYKFRRQYPIDRFIVDFYCPEEKLIIEIDGTVHQNQQEHDQERTEILEALGYRLRRYTNEQVKQHLPDLLQEISELLETNNPHIPFPLLRKREREQG
jgi:very-short-patch-repair endonuclease